MTRTVAVACAVIAAPPIISVARAKASVFISDPQRRERHAAILTPHRSRGPLPVVANDDLAACEQRRVHVIDRTSSRFVGTDLQPVLQLERPEGGVVQATNLAGGGLDAAEQGGGVRLA